MPQYRVTRRTSIHQVVSGRTIRRKKLSTRYKQLQLSSTDCCDHCSDGSNGTSWRAPRLSRKVAPVISSMRPAE